MAKVTVLFTLVVLCVGIGVCSEASNRKLITTDSRLPTPRYLHAAVYDGADSIFIIGGTHAHYSTDEILQYSLDSGRVDVVARLPHPSDGVSAIAVEGNVIMLGGGAGTGDSANIMRFNQATNAVSIIGTLPLPLFAASTALNTDTGIAYVLGGNSSTSVTDPEPIITYDTRTQTATKVGEYPRLYRPALAWDQEGGVAYLIGGHYDSTSGRRDIHKFDPALNTVVRYPAVLPYELETACAAWVNGGAYVVYGDQLLRFDPGLDRTDTVDVDGWPGLITNAACVYVPKQDRIYIIGGFVDDIGEDRIRYIQMSEGPVTGGSQVTTISVYGSILGMLLVVTMFYNH